ncbi:glycosyltransferase family 4 protein [Spiractinospora alimapuensis]|uniref:glycosyltransferase family 4 protein n=1 Tax=Spiractinospora alimapuensis TaxID=2820884 RepID=UPI001F1F764B|nr:glycosyltransferase family 4 protein [Spiractinospora alimapuensis]
MDDPSFPSGGNVYDRRVCDELRRRGLSVQEAAVAGPWPCPDDDARARLDETLGSVADGATVLMDGLVACGTPGVVLPHTRRLRIAVLVHLPLAEETGLAPEEARRRDARERRVLRAVPTVVATSQWAAEHLRARHLLPESRIHVAAPGTDPAPVAAGTTTGTRLVCVAALTPRKGQDTLIAALARLRDLDWECLLVGPDERDARFADALRSTIRRSALTDRVRLLGPRSATELAEIYHHTDLAVLPSHTETYAMVVTEALARAIPVLTTTGGALPNTLGEVTEGGVPGILVPPGEVGALTSALRMWLTEVDTRRRLRRAATSRRTTLSGWGETARCMVAALERTRAG